MRSVYPSLVIIGTPIGNWFLSVAEYNSRHIGTFLVPWHQEYTCRWNVYTSTCNNYVYMHTWVNCLYLNSNCWNVTVQFSQKCAPCPRLHASLTDCIIECYYYSCLIIYIVQCSATLWVCGTPNRCGLLRDMSLLTSYVAWDYWL